MEKKLALSIAEAAEALGVASSTVRTMISTGQLKATRVGIGKGKWLVSRQALDDLLAGKVA